MTVLHFVSVMKDNPKHFFWQSYRIHVYVHLPTFTLTSNNNNNKIPIGIVEKTRHHQTSSPGSFGKIEDPASRLACSFLANTGWPWRAWNRLGCGVAAADAISQLCPWIEEALLGMGCFFVFFSCPEWGGVFFSFTQRVFSIFRKGVLPVVYTYCTWTWAPKEIFDFFGNRFKHV